MPVTNDGPNKGVAEQAWACTMKTSVLKGTHQGFCSFSDTEVCQSSLKGLLAQNANHIPIAQEFIFLTGFKVILDWFEQYCVS